MIRKSNHSISDFPTPRYDNDPQNATDAPCELVDPEQVDADFCRRCGAECPEMEE